MLSSFTRHRHLVHAGYSFSGNGSWILQDGTFSGNDLLDALREPDVQRVTRAYETSINIHIHCPEEGIWRSDALLQDPVYAASKVVMNPPDKGAVPPEVDTFINYLEEFLGPSSLDQLLTPSDVVGNIRFSRPTLYVFPGGQGDAAMFGINGFNILFDGGFSRRACCWNFVRHLDRLDAVLMSRLNNGSLMGMSAMLQRKVDNATYPQIGHFFANMIDQKEPPVGDKDGDPLLVNTQLEAQRLLINLKALALKPTPCLRDNSSDPINLYHKVGHGRLDLYVLNPQRDGAEMQAFLKSWTEGPGKSRVNVKVKGKEFPVANLVSICCLLVWVPDDRHDTVTRLLFPGSAPQQKVFEGLDRLKHLQFMKTPVCFAKALETKKHKTSDILQKSSQVPSATRRAERIERMEVEHKQRRVRSTSRHDRNGDRDAKKADKAKGHELLAEIKAKKQEANKERAEKVPLKSGEKIEKLDPRKESKPPQTSLPKKSGALKDDNKRGERPGDEKYDKVPRRDTAEGSTPVKVKKDVNNKMIVEEKKIPRPPSKSKQIKMASEVKTTKVVESKIEKVTGSGVISKQPEPKKSGDKAKPRVGTKSEKAAGVKSRIKPPASPKKVRGIKPKSIDVNKLDMTSTLKSKQDTDPEVSTMRGTGDIEEVTMAGDMLTVTKVTTEVQRIIEEIHEGSAVDSLEHVSGDFSRDIETDSLELRKVDEKIDSLKQSPTTEDSKDLRQSSEEQMRRTDIEEAVLMQPSRTSPERPDGFQVKMNDLPHATAPQKKDVVKTPDEVAELPEHEALELPEHEGHQCPAKSIDETESGTRSEAKLGEDNYGDRREREVEVTEDTEKEKDSLADDRPMSSPEKAEKEQLNARLKDSSPEEPTAPEESATESPHDSSERDAHVETGGEPSPKNSSRSRQDIICASPRREMYPIGEPYVERGVEAETHHETVQMEKPEMVMITSSATTPSPISPTKGDRWAVDAQLLPIVDERSLEEVVSQAGPSAVNVDEIRTEGKASKDVGMTSTGQVDTKTDWGQDNKYSVEQVGLDLVEDEQVLTISRTYMTDRSEELLVGSSQNAPSSSRHAIAKGDTMDKTSLETTKEVAKGTEQQEYTERGISEPKKPVEKIKQAHTEVVEHKGIVHQEYPTESQKPDPANEFLTEQAALVLGTIPEPKKSVHEKEAMALSPEAHHAISTSDEGRSAKPAKSPDHHEQVVTHRIEEAIAQSEEIQTKISSILSPTGSELAASRIHEAPPKNDEICDTDDIKLPSSGHVDQATRSDVSFPSDMMTEPITEPDVQKGIQHQEPPQSAASEKPLVSSVLGTPIGVFKDTKEAHETPEHISEEHHKAFLAEQAELVLETRDGVQQSPTAPVQTRSPPVPHKEVIEGSENQGRLDIDQDDVNGSQKSTTPTAAHVKEQDTVEKPVTSPALGTLAGVLRDTKEVHGEAKDISEEHHKAFLTEQAELALETRDGVQQSPTAPVQTRSPPVPHKEVIEGSENQGRLDIDQDDANGSQKSTTPTAAHVKEQDTVEKPVTSPALGTLAGVLRDTKEVHGEAKDISEEHHKAFLTEQAELALETRDGVQQSPTAPVQTRSSPVPHKEVIEGSENQGRLDIDQDDANGSQKSTTPTAAHVKEQDTVEKPVTSPALGTLAGVLKDTKEVHGEAKDNSEEHHKAFLTEQAGLALEIREEVQQPPMVSVQARSPPVPREEAIIAGSEIQRRLHAGEDDANGSLKRVTPIASDVKEQDVLEEPLVSSVLGAPIGVLKDSKELHGETKDISEEHHKAFLAEQAELALETRDEIQQSSTVPVQTRSPPVPHQEVIEGSENQRRMHIDEDDANDSRRSTTPIVAHVKEQDAVEKSVMSPILDAPSRVLKDTKEDHGAAEDISEEHHKAFLVEQAGLVLERRDEVQKSSMVPEPTRSQSFPHEQDATERSESHRRLRKDEDDADGIPKSVTPIAAHGQEPDVMVQHDVLGQRELETDSRAFPPSDETLSEVGGADSKDLISSSVLSNVSSDGRKMSEEMHVITREEAITETIRPAAADDVEKSPTKSTPKGIGGDQREDIPYLAVDMKNVQEVSTVQDEHQKATAGHISRLTPDDIQLRPTVPSDASEPAGFAGAVKDSVAEKGVPVKGGTQTERELHGSKVDEDLGVEHVPVSDREQHGESQSPKGAQKDRESIAAFFKQQIEIGHDERTISKDAFMVDSDTRPSKNIDVSSDIITEKAAEAEEQYRPLAPTVVREIPGTLATSVTTLPTGADDVHALDQAVPEHVDTKTKLKATDFSIEKADQDVEKSQSRTDITTREQVVLGKESLSGREQAHAHHMPKVDTKGDDTRTAETSYITPPISSPETFVEEPLPLTTSHIMVSTTMDLDGSGRPSGLISDATASTMQAEDILCSTASPPLSSIESQVADVPLPEKSVESSPSTSSRKTSYIIEEVEVISPRQRRQYEDVEEIVTYSPSRRSRTLSETSGVSNVSDMSQLRSEASILSEHIQEATDSQGAAKTARTPVTVSVSSKTVSSVAAGRRVSDGKLDLDDGLTSDQGAHGTCIPSPAKTQSELVHESTGSVPLEYKMGVVEEKIEIAQETFGTSAIPPSKLQDTSVMPGTSAIRRNIDEDDLMSQIISGRDIAPGIVAPTRTQADQEEGKELIQRDKSPVAETVAQALQSRVDEVAISDEHDIATETVTRLNGRTDLGVGDSTLPHKFTTSPGFDHSNLTADYVQAEVEDLLLQTGLITVAKSASYEELTASYGKTADSTLKSELPGVCDDKPKSSEMDLDSLLSRMQAFDTDVDSSGKTSSPGHPETGLQPSVKRRKSRDLTSTLEGLEHDIEALQSIKPDRLKDRDVCIGNDDGHDYALDAEGPITCKTVADLGPISKDSDTSSDRPLGSPGKKMSPPRSPVTEPILSGHRKGSPSTEIEMIKRDHDMSLDDQVVEDVLEKTSPTSKHVASYLTRATTSSTQKQIEAAEGSVPIPTTQTADGASVIVRVGDGQKTSGTSEITSLSPAKGGESPQAAEPTPPMQKPQSTSSSKDTTQKEGEVKSTTTPVPSQEIDSKLKSTSEEADDSHALTPEKDASTETSQSAKDDSEVSGVRSKEDDAETKADQEHEIKQPAKKKIDDVKQSSVPQKDDVDARKFSPADVSAQFLKTEDSMNGNNEPPLPESDGAIFQELRDAGGILSAFVPGIASRFEDVVTAPQTEGHTPAQFQDGVTSPPSVGATVRVGDIVVASQRQEGPATATQPDAALSGAVAPAAPSVGGDVTTAPLSADRPDGCTEGPDRPLSPFKDVVDSATGKAQVRSEKGDRVDDAVAVVVSDVGKHVESSGASRLLALDADTQAAVHIVGEPVHPPDGISLSQTDMDSSRVPLASEMSAEPYTVGWVERPTSDRGLDFSEATAHKPIAESDLKAKVTSITMGVVQQEQSGITDIKDTTGSISSDLTSVDMKTDVAETISDKPQDIEEDRSVIDFTAVGRTVAGVGGGIPAKDKEIIPGGRQPTELTMDTFLEQKLPTSTGHSTTKSTSSEGTTIAPSGPTGIAGIQSYPGRTSSVPLEAVQPGTPPDISMSSTITSTLSGLTGESTDDPDLTRTETKDRRDAGATPPDGSTSTQQILPEGIQSDEQQLGAVSRDITDVAPSREDVVEVSSSSKATCDVSATGEKHEQEVSAGTDTVPPDGKLDDMESVKEVVEDKASVMTEAPQLSPEEGCPYVSSTFAAAKDVAESAALSSGAISPESGTVTTQIIDSKRKAEKVTSKAPTLTTTTDGKSLRESQTLDSATCDPTTTQPITSEQGDVLPAVLSEGKEVGLVTTPHAGLSPTGTVGTLPESTASVVDATVRPAEHKLTSVRESASVAADRVEATSLKTEPRSHQIAGASDKAATLVGDSTTSDAHKPMQDPDESAQSIVKPAIALASSAGDSASSSIRSLGDSIASEGIIAGRELDSDIRADTVASELHQIAVKTAEEVVGRVTSAAKEKALDVAITDVQDVDDKTSKAGIQEHATDRKPSAKSSDNALTDKKLDSHDESVTKITGDLLKTGAQITSAKVESTSKALEQALESGVQKAAKSIESSTETVAGAFTRGVDTAASSVESATKSVDEALKTAAQSASIQAQTTAEGLGESLASAAKACEDHADSATKAAEKVISSAQSAADETKALVRAADKELTSTAQQEVTKVESIVTSTANVVHAGLNEIKDAAQTGNEMLESGVQSISEQAELCTKAADEALASAVHAVDSKVADGVEESLASAHHITAAMAGSAADAAARTLSAAQRAGSQVQDSAVTGIADTSDRLTGATEEKLQEAERAIIQGVQKLGKLSKATDDQANKAVQGVGRVADELAQSASETLSQMGQRSSDITAELARQSSDVMKDAEDVLKGSVDSAASSMLSVGEGLSAGISGVESGTQAVGEHAAAGVTELSESLYRSADACLEEADSALEDAGTSVRSAFGGLFGFGRRKSSKDASPTKESPKAERKGGFFSKMFGRKSPDDPTQLEAETRPESVPEPAQPTDQRQPVQEVIHRADIRVQLDDDDRRRSSSELSDIREEASGSGRSSSREPSSPRGVLEAQTSATEPQTQQPTAVIDPMTSSMHESFHDVMTGSIHEALQGADGAFAMPGVEFRQPRSPPQSLSPAVQDGEDDAAVPGWGPPLGLPPPVPPADHGGIPTPPPTKRAIMSRARASDSPRAARLSGPPPVYLDLVYVPHHANAFYSSVQFFHRIRARYYVFSSIEPSQEVFNALLEAKQHWEDKNLEVTIIPTYDTDTLGHWFASNEQQLEDLRIDLAPSASRCTINLQDHETSCAAYRLEF